MVLGSSLASSLFSGRSKGAQKMGGAGEGVGDKVHP